jgi:two-component system sensor histidine kinase MprB
VLWATPTLVMGDRKRLARAVRNLLDNALKWSPRDGAIDVSVDPSGVAVRDRGPGIDRADLPFVFDRFYRSPDAGRAGTGLGLAIVRQVALAHGGSVRAERALGGGARVVMTLPGEAV